MITRKNPPGVAPPVGAYSHLVVVPPGAALLVIAGQIGAAPDGTVPESAADQLRNCTANIMQILEAEGLSADALIKVNIWLTEPSARPEMLACLAPLMAEVMPASTLAFVSALARPHFKAEVEAWAARMPPS